MNRSGFVEVLEDRTLLSASVSPFTSPVVVSDDGMGDGGDESSPEMATDGQGNWLAVWSAAPGGSFGTDQDLFFARSTNNGLTWTAPSTLNTNATTDSGHDTAPHIATSGSGTWIATWQSTDRLGNTIGSDSDILFARSTNNGQTWTAPAALATTASSDTPDDQTPHIATDGDGNWITVWRSYEVVGVFQFRDDIFAARSTNDGVTWSAPVALSSHGITDAGNDSNPTIASDGGQNWVVAWETTNTLSNSLGTDNDLLVTRSTNDGLTWTTPTALNSNATSDTANDSTVSLSAAGSGTWVATWRSFESTGFGSSKDDIVVARSTNNGQSWSSATALTTSGTNDPGTDWNPEVVAGGGSFWVVLWQSTDPLSNTVGADNDILVSSSSNNGQTWTAPAALASNAATDSGDDRSPHAATDQAGHWVIAWQSDDDLGGTIGSDDDILVVRSSNNGQTLSSPTALNTNAASSSADDINPSITTNGSGTWVAVWQTTAPQNGVVSGESDIQFARSANNGQTWSTAAALNSNAASDSGSDTLPQVVADGAGHWVTVWQSDDDLSGTIGTDRDILYARSIDNGITWTAPAAVNTNATSDSSDESTPSLATDGSGNWIAVWRSYQETGVLDSRDDIVISRSTNNGQSWSAPVTITSVATPDSGNDANPQIVTDGAGQWIVVWESDDTLGNTIWTDDDILISRSTNNGLTWSSPAVLNANADVDSHDDHAPQLAGDGDGNWVAVWQSDESLGGSLGTDLDILTARSSDGGQTWTYPSALNNFANSDFRDDLSPDVSVDKAGNWVTAWESFQNVGGTIESDADILVAQSTDLGQTWSNATILNANAASDAGDDFAPQLATNGVGKFLAVWTSTDDLAGTIGTDPDILSASATANVHDFGDAPTSYPTLLANNGARHLATGPMLGSSRDTESDGQPSFIATGDDAISGGDDEDGIVFNGPLVEGQVASIDVTVSGGSASLSAWIDFNRDGDWNDAGERLTLSQSNLTTGTTTVTFTVPAAVTPGATFARFRLSTQEASSVTGVASDGEVEDYQVVISDSATPGQLTVTTDDQPTSNPGDDGNADTFQLERHGADIDITIDGTSTIRTQASLVNHLIINGTSDDDTLTIDWSSGDPIPSNGVSFAGAGQTTLGDTLVLTGGSHSSVTHAFANANDGSVDVDGGTISYTGLEPISDQLLATDRVFTFPDTADEITLGDDAVSSNGMSHVASVASSETVDFRVPTGSLTINAGDGDDVLVASPMDSTFDASVYVNGDAGGDFLDLRLLPNAATISGGSGNDILKGGLEADLMSGDDGNDHMDGGDRNDTLSGGLGDDTLSGGRDDDLLIGGEGNDGLFGANGDDTLTGGLGNDYLKGQGDDAGDVVMESGDVDLLATATTLTGVGTDTLVDVEALHLTGGPSANRISVGSFYGRSTLYGEGGDDTLVGGKLEDLIYGGDGNDRAFGGAKRDTLYGGDGDDYMSGQGSSLDYVSGGRGNDRLFGGSGVDRIIVVADAKEFRVTDTQIIITHVDDSVEIDQHDVAGEQMHITGGASNSLFDGTAFSGNNYFFGGDGDDTLLGGLGNDRMTGEGGNDLVIGSTGIDSVSGGDGNDTVDGGEGNDRVFGQNDDDLLIPGLGADRINGGYGYDVLREERDVPTLKVTTKYLYTDIRERFTLVEAIELIGGDGNNTLNTTDFSGPATLRGGGGNDYLLSGGSDDLLEGGEGNDTLKGNDGADTLLGGAGDDTLRGGAGDDVLNGGIGNDSLSGSSGNDSLSGWDGSDTLAGENDNDVVLGGAGDDSLTGGLGDDTLLGDAQSDTIEGGDGIDVLAGRGNYQGATTSDTGNTVADAGDSFLDGETVDETFLAVGDWIDTI